MADTQNVTEIYIKRLDKGFTMSAHFGPQIIRNYAFTSSEEVEAAVSVALSTWMMQAKWVMQSTSEFDEAVPVQQAEIHDEVSS